MRCQDKCRISAQLLNSDIPPEATRDSKSCIVGLRDSFLTCKRSLHLAMHALNSLLASHGFAEQIAVPETSLSNTYRVLEEVRVSPRECTYQAVLSLGPSRRQDNMLLPTGTLARKCCTAKLK